MKKLWVQAKQGGVILSRPKQYLTRAFLPSFLSWLCKLGRDRDLPGRVRDPGHVRVDHVGGGVGLARERRLVHAGRGRDHAGDERPRARHVLQRRRATTAIDYSTAQQLITTAWNVVVAIVLVVLVFGWTRREAARRRSPTSTRR